MNTDDNENNGDSTSLPKNNKSAQSPFTRKSLNDSETISENSEGNVLTDEPTENYRTSLERVYDDEPSEDPVLNREKRKARITKRRWLVGILTAAVLGVAGVLIYVLTAGTTVPKAMDNVSMTADETEICAEFTSKSLACSVMWEINPEEPRGALLDQSLEADSKVDKDTSVVLTYSNGPAETEMPDIAGMTLEDAEAALYPGNVTIQEVSEVSGSGAPEGQIISASVPAGSTVANGTEITLEVSSGKAVIPDWTDKSRELVEAEAKELGIDVTFKEEESEKASNLVMSQTPSAGETVSNETVEVVVSKAFESREIKIPDVIGKSADDAQSELASAGFRQIKTVVVKNSEVTETQVTQVVPGVGQTGKSEENVVLIVSEPNN